MKRPTLNPVGVLALANDTETSRGFSQETSSCPTGHHSEGGIDCAQIPWPWNVESALVSARMKSSAARQDEGRVAFRDGLRFGHDTFSAVLWVSRITIQGSSVQVAIVIP